MAAVAIMVFAVVARVLGVQVGMAGGGILFASSIVVVVFVRACACTWV